MAYISKVTLPDGNEYDIKAAQLKDARTISLAGDVTGTTSFDGSGNVSIQTTITAATAAEVNAVCT